MDVSENYTHKGEVSVGSRAGLNWGTRNGDIAEDAAEDLLEPNTADPPSTAPHPRHSPLANRTVHFKSADQHA